MQTNRSPKPENPRNMALTETEALYERLHNRGLTHEQIAGQTGRTVATVRNALCRVRDKRRDQENLAKVKTK